jgi:hypothetical protein
MNALFQLPDRLNILDAEEIRQVYACRELVIAYAAWISPAFHLKVIRVFLDAQKQEATPKKSLGDSPVVTDTRWQLYFGTCGRHYMSRIPDGTLMQTREELLVNIQQRGYAPMFSTDYVQKLAVACIHRLDAELEQWKAETGKAYGFLREANFKIRELQKQ